MTQDGSDPTGPGGGSEQVPCLSGSLSAVDDSRREGLCRLGGMDDGEA